MKFFEKQQIRNHGRFKETLVSKSRINFRKMKQQVIFSYVNNLLKMLIKFVLNK